MTLFAISLCFDIATWRKTACWQHISTGSVNRNKTFNSLSHMWAYHFPLYFGFQISIIPFNTRTVNLPKFHYNTIKLSSWRLTSLAIQLFVQQHVHCVLWFSSCYFHRFCHISFEVWPRLSAGMGSSVCKLHVHAELYGSVSIGSSIW